jgi:hypothetical protein
VKTTIRGVKLRNWKTKREATADVELSIDLDMIAHELAQRAFVNKVHTSTQAGGLIRVELGNISWKEPT